MGAGKTNNTAILCCCDYDSKLLASLSNSDVYSVLKKVLQSKKIWRNFWCEVLKRMAYLLTLMDSRPIYFQPCSVMQFCRDRMARCYGSWIRLNIAPRIARSIIDLTAYSLGEDLAQIFLVMLFPILRTFSILYFSKNFPTLAKYSYPRQR